MICLDSCFLILLIRPDSPAPHDPATKKPVHRLSDRIQDLIDQWKKTRVSIVVPTPVLCETLYKADDVYQEYDRTLQLTAKIKVKPFDRRAAIELACLYKDLRASMSKSAKKEDDVETHETNNKIKFDRQIVAIAKANNCTEIYTNDKSLANFAERVGIKAIRCHELPMPDPRKVALPFPSAQAEG